MAEIPKTIFDSPWFAFERPAFEKIAQLSDAALTVLLICASIIIFIFALWPNHPVFKAVLLAYIIMP